MTGTADIFVLWLVPKAWEEEGRLLPQHAPMALQDWLQTIQEEGMTVRPVPHSRIAGGPCDGGHVVAVEDALASHLFALPPEALPALAEVLPAAEHQRLLQPDAPPVEPSVSNDRAVDGRTDGSTWTTALVYGLDPVAWDTRQAVVPLGEPLPVHAWLRLLRDAGQRAVSLSAVLAAPERPWDAGRIVGLDGPQGRSYVAVPPAARVVLDDLFGRAGAPRGSDDGRARAARAGAEGGADDVDV
jgi:hypothetical protein